MVSQFFFVKCELSAVFYVCKIAALNEVFSVPQAETSFSAKI